MQADVRSPEAGTELRGSRAANEVSDKVVSLDLLLLDLSIIQVSTQPQLRLPLHVEKQE